MRQVNLQYSGDIDYMSIAFRIVYVLCDSSFMFDTAC